ncbi:DUF6249 domain-containing protein [Rhodohalobacter sp.]|uniref:DUF6249 domain-containing protein n=1 Tax=Rhodohalobacter sp. TaxID=1974210 RepID=UPI003567067F
MNQIIFTIIFLAFLTAGFLAWYFSHKSREKERMLLIEKGQDVPEQKNGWSFSFRFPWLKLGVLITAIATGLIFGILISEITDIRAEFEPIMMLLFGGIGMIIAHYVGKKDNG